MAQIPKDIGSGGRNLNPSGNTAKVTLKKILFEIQEDLAAIRTAVVGITAKLDADTGVADTDYASSLDPAALKTTKES